MGKKKRRRIVRLYVYVITRKDNFWKSNVMGLLVSFRENHTRDVPGEVEPTRTETSV